MRSQVFLRKSIFTGKPLRGSPVKRILCQKRKRKKDFSQHTNPKSNPHPEQTHQHMQIHINFSLHFQHANETTSTADGCMVIVLIAVPSPWWWSSSQCHHQIWSHVELAAAIQPRSPPVPLLRREEGAVTATKRCRHVACLAVAGSVAHGPRSSRTSARSPPLLRLTAPAILVVSPSVTPRFSRGVKKLIYENPICENFVLECRV